MKKELIELRINGRTHELAAEPNALLLDVLRQNLGLTGSKRGCDESSCGACTVMIDGVPMLSCALLAASCQGQEITTVEGVAEHGGLAAIQQAYGRWGGAQCGYCTPGFIMTVKHLLENNSDPSEERDSAGAQRESVPLHRIRADVSGGEGCSGCRAQGLGGGEIGPHE